METNKEVYAAVIRLLEERGPSFTTAELTQQLHISKRTLYKIFKTKADIIEATIAFFFHNLFESWQVADSDKKLSSSRLLEIQLKNMNQSYDLDRLLQHSQKFEKMYPEQWKKLQMYVDKFGELTLNFLVDNQNVRILTSSEKKVLLLTIQLTVRRFLDGEYLKAEGMNFKEALQNFYHLILRGILY
ncbi:TetR/AcrR family transcriptional regulator [Liquorilactobacillus oeni]|uniref:HTH tetR-type domain-containing protein n=1 Tax=Liquorilactobacillus oeni DSM 19972 TaxID=1423777 RepID=A0A0R1MM91_9LACO|nr:TetR/AcrR family transcriptional regulator [Liquorilactobacillus oeni]KRL05731.1 hypothetical protein FD46_GL000482 [Liquorilactobacillus oeni DSM 19972]